MFFSKNSLLSSNSKVWVLLCATGTISKLRLHRCWHTDSQIHTVLLSEQMLQKIWCSKPHSPAFCSLAAERMVVFVWKSGGLHLRLWHVLFIMTIDVVTETRKSCSKCYKFSENILFFWWWSGASKADAVAPSVCYVQSVVHIDSALTLFSCHGRNSIQLALITYIADNPVFHFHCQKK